jgi:hypothetical protein
VIEAGGGDITDLALGEAEDRGNGAPTAGGEV